MTEFKLTKSMSPAPVLEAIEVMCEANPLGVFVTVETAQPEKTEKQHRGYWWLIGQWLRLGSNSLVGVNKNDLHQWVCCKHFGYIEREMPDGRIDWIPVRTTTRIWDEDQKKYRRKLLPRERETELIDFVYRAASDAGVVLPDLLPEYERELRRAA